MTPLYLVPDLLHLPKTFVVRLKNHDVIFSSKLYIPFPIPGVIAAMTFGTLFQLDPVDPADMSNVKG